jgi:hypothetical protein
MILAADVLKVLSNEESLELFGIVTATTDSNTDIIINKIKLTRKQYYFRMSELMKAGLIKKKNGKHSFTAFGKVVYNTQMKIENAVNNFWKLKTIDLLEDSHTLSTTERKKLIYELIDNQEIKDILVSDNDNDYNDNYNNNENKLESDQRSLVATDKVRHIDGF